MNRALGPGAFRLFLALAVVFQHAGVLGLGAWAVFVFFILSGYWVTAMWEGSYLQARQPYLTFLISRYWRLLPVYLACQLLITGLYWFRSPHWPEMLAHWQDPLWVARALAIVSSSFQPIPLVPAWSLDVEVQFYVALPAIAAIVAWCLSRPPLLRASGLVALLAIATLAYFEFHIGRFAIFFLIGVLLWKLRWAPSFRWAWASAAATIAIGAALWISPDTHCFIAGFPNEGVTEQLKAGNKLVSALLALVAVPFVAWNVRVPSDSVDRHLGNLAYSVYLFHYIVQFAFDLMISFRGWPKLVELSLQAVLVAAGSLGLYWCIDHPTDRLRRAWVKSRRLSAPGAPSSAGTPG